MKKTFTLFALFSAFVFASAQTSSIHGFTTFSIDGDSIKLSDYYGKKLMIVNVASYCGYTPQYNQLQEMDSLYSSHNFQIIGFPCDDFGHQGGNDSEIIATCNSYHVTFPITETVKINTTPVNPIFDWLKKQSLNGVSNASVSWNFNKFLIDEAGHWVRHYTQTTLPNDQAIIDWILSPSVINSAPSFTIDDLIELKSSNPTSTSIDFMVKNSGLKNLNIQLFGSTGNLIGTVYNGSVEGSQNISYSVSGLSSGIYFVKMQSGGVAKTVKCAVVN
jgi:glutathione peroxidase